MSSKDEFIEHWSRAASEVAMAFAGEPEDRVRHHLDQTRARMVRRLLPVGGKAFANALAEAFVESVLDGKHKIERAAGSQPEAGRQ